MKRYAAHYIYISPVEIYKYHCIELDNGNVLKKIFTLIEEVEDTAFINGILFPVALNEPFHANEKLQILHSFQTQYPEKNIFELLGLLNLGSLHKETPVVIYQLDSIRLSPTCRINKLLG